MYSLWSWWPHFSDIIWRHIMTSYLSNIYHISIRDSCVFLCILGYSCVFYFEYKTWYNDVIIWCHTRHSDVTKQHHRIIFQPYHVFLCILVYSCVFMCILVYCTLNRRPHLMTSSYDVILIKQTTQEGTRIPTNTQEYRRIHSIATRD